MKDAGRGDEEGRGVGRRQRRRRPFRAATRRSPSCAASARPASGRGNLGQNSSIDLNLQQVLIEAAAVGPDDVVLEIGTGTGGMTGLLARRAAAVVTVEIDRHLFRLAGEALHEVLQQGNVTMLQADALAGKHRLNPEMLAAVDERLSAVPGRRFKFVANLPYSVATPILTNLLALERPPER